jgi:hypothetical protein
MFFVPRCGVRQTGPEDTVKVTEDIVDKFKVKCQPIKDFTQVWNSQDTQSQSQVSLWYPSLQVSMMSSNRVRTSCSPSWWDCLVCGGGGRQKSSCVVVFVAHVCSCCFVNQDSWLPVWRAGRLQRSLRREWLRAL